MNLALGWPETEGLQWWGCRREPPDPTLAYPGCHRTGGFRAAGIAAGIKQSGAPDLALVFNEGPDYAAAGCSPATKVKAAPGAVDPTGAEHRPSSGGAAQLRWGQRLHGAGRLRGYAHHRGGGGRHLVGLGYRKRVPSKSPSAPPA